MKLIPIYLKSKKSQNSIFKYGSFKVLKPDVVNSTNPMVAMYQRSTWFKRAWIITNIGWTSQRVKVNLDNLKAERILLNTHSTIIHRDGILKLQPYQGIVVKV